ncbi:MAG: hypothetical protein ABSB42_07460 [Tepidisphaeraceae bacterium]|jgi:alginate O-acetyltransferase complex protein AlgJ
MSTTPATTAARVERQGAFLPPQRRAHRRLTLVRVLAALFLASLFLPLIGLFFHWDPAGASNENRRLAEPPSFPRSFNDLTRYSERWLSFYRDHFGLRNTLIRGVALTRFHGLRDEMDGNVVIGKDGWLFLRPEGDENFIAYRGLNPLSDEQLDAWQNLLEKRNAWLAARGIPYLVVVPPDKQTIYPERLPPELTPVRPESRLDQLVNRLRQSHSPIHFLDLRPALLAAKPYGLLYHRTDTHWNDSGAFVGYREIIHAVKDLLPQWNIVPQTLEDFTVGSPGAEVGDLARMMDMPDQYPDQGFPLIRKKFYPVDPALSDTHRVVTIDNHDPKVKLNLPRLVFYRDSFGIGLVPMLGPHFSRIVYAFQYTMDPALIQLQKPDLVIDEFLERNLYTNPPTDPPAIRGFTAP